MKINLLKIKNEFLKNKKFGIFSILKYVEYVINAFLFFEIARRVSPSEYGSASSSFFLITYSAFFVLGVNQVLVKRYSLVKHSNVKEHLILYSFLFNLIFSVILFVLICLFYEKNYKIAVALISCSKLITEGIVSIFRATGKIFLINIIYILQALIFFILFIFFVNDINGFFRIWGISAFLGTGISLVLLFSNKLINNICWLEFKNFIKIENLILLKEGFVFTIMSFIGILFISIDRFFYINIFNFNTVMLGNIQLADSISNVVTLGFSSFLFIVTPSILNNLSNLDQKSRVEFILKSYLIVLVIFVGVMIFLLPGSFLIVYLYPQYENLTYPLFMGTIVKFLNIALFIPNLIYIVKNKETDYVKISMIGICIISLTLLLFSIINIESIRLFYLVPVVLILGILLVHLIFFNVFKGSNFKNEINISI